MVSEDSSLQIRSGLREKLIHFYSNTFSNILGMLKIFEGIEAELLQHSVAIMSDKTKIKKNEDGTTLKHIHFNNELSYNYQIIIQEIIDDYLAAYNCFINGFTKQAQQILRNTIELTVQMHYLKYIEVNDHDWITSNRGISKISDKIELLRKTKDKKLFSSLNKIYNQLCTATHSHKDRMTSLTMPRGFSASDTPSFTGFEITYTKALFFTVIAIETKMIKTYLSDEPQTLWLSNILEKFTNVLEKTNEYDFLIRNFEKGYLVHREHAVISDNKQILYSITLDRDIKCVGKKKKITVSQKKVFDDIVENRLLTDDIKKV